MIDALKRTLVGTLDLSEQEKTPYILIVGGAIGRAYYYVSSWKQEGDNMVFYAPRPYINYMGERRSSDEVIYVCRQEGMWGIIRADLTEQFSNEDLIRTSKKESEQVEALHKELEPPVVEGGADEKVHGRGIYL